MKTMQVIYTKVTPDIVKEHRKFFRKHVKRAFVRWLAYNHYLDGICTPAELKAAKKGHLAEDLDIHHKVPLSATADPDVNAFNNLCVLHKETHKYINKTYFQPQLKDIMTAPYGTTQVIDIPAFPYVDTENILRERKKVLDNYRKPVYNIFTKDGQR